MTKTDTPTITPFPLPVPKQVQEGHDPGCALTRTVLSVAWADHVHRFEGQPISVMLDAWDNPETCPEEDIELKVLPFRQAIAREWCWRCGEPIMPEDRVMNGICELCWRGGAA